MKREQLSNIIRDIDEQLIAEAYRYDPDRGSRSSERTVHMSKKKIITFALVAALVLSLVTVAYAVFSVYTARVPASEETFRIKWEENAGGYIEWTDVKLAVTFPETAESREIEFRPGWLPEELSLLKTEKWLDRLTAEGLRGNYPDMTGYQPLLIEIYYMSMFNDGGALLLLYYTPENVIEEHWDEQGVEIMRFHATQVLPANDYSPELMLEQDILLMSNPKAGWVIRLAGEAGMDTLVKVAKNLEIRETGNALTYDGFADHYTFMDGGVG